jgi:hypothetical protein
MRRGAASLAPVYLQIMDNDKLGEIQGHCRKGTGFQVKFELGPGRTEMGITEFKRRLDDHMRQRSEIYDSVMTGKILTHMHKEVEGTVHAYCKYIVTGKMRGGYVRTSQKFGHRVAGHTGGKLRGGLRWAGQE